MSHATPQRGPGNLPWAWGWASQMGTCYLGSHRDRLPGGDSSQTKYTARWPRGEGPGAWEPGSGSRWEAGGPGAGECCREGASGEDDRDMPGGLASGAQHPANLERKRSRCEARGDPRATVGTWVLGGAGLRGHPVCRARGDLGGQREVVTFSTGFQGRAP